jgi:hypothetical protein
VLQDTTEAIKARRSAIVANETAARAHALESLRSALAGRQALVEDAARLEVEAQQHTSSLGGKVDALLEDGSAALWASLDEGLRDWRAAVGEQEERLVALKTETRSSCTLCNPKNKSFTVHILAFGRITSPCPDLLVRLYN